MMGENKKTYRKGSKGERHWNLTAVAHAEGLNWWFICDCGEYVIKTFNAVRTGNAKSCGCGYRKRCHDLSGARFGRLLVLRKTGERRGLCGQVIWLCSCDCGNMSEVSANDLVRGSTLSCGCYGREMSRKRRLKHGEGRTKLYVLWRGIKSRCYDKNVKSYKYYGDRGISVCEEWQNSFEIFRIWAKAHGYKEGLTIDRIDPSGNYEPGNCQWLTRSENSQKRWHDESAINCL